MYYSSPRTSGLLQDNGEYGRHPTATAAGRPTVLPKGLLSFRLGREEYGIDILRVQEIRRYEAPTRIANAPAFIKGVVNLRGVIAPIIDLRVKLNCPPAEYTGFTAVIVLNMQGRVTGVVVDSVSDVIELDPVTVKPAPSIACDVIANCIVGIACHTTDDQERMLLLMDIEALIGRNEIGWMDSSTVH